MIKFKVEKELQEAILREKAKGTPDVEIGQKYGVSLKYIEKIITKSQGINVSSLKTSRKIKTLHPKNFREEQTTVWSFKQRGNWATHSGEYRGNWSPYIPRNIILKYSKPGELVLDYFCGSGTTAVECKILGRKCIALDINDKAIELAKKNLNFTIEAQQLTFADGETSLEIYEPQVLVGDARDLSFLQDNSVDLICAHPPYANIIHYTDSKEGDLSHLDVEEFLKEMAKVAKESFRVLKPGKKCAILIGDIRREKHVVPLGFELINVYLDAGFKLRELVIKRQHNCRTTGIWYEKSIKHNFLLLAHEYLPIFEKPETPTYLINISEKEEPYGLLLPMLEKPVSREKLKNLETTTVWVLPEKNFDECINKNVIDRYSNGKDYSVITFVSHSKGEIKFAKENSLKNYGLLFIKSPFLSSKPSYSYIEYYLKEIRQIVNQELSNIDKGGFIVIQTQDVRVNGYVEPLAKRLVDELKHENLWLKEIVVVTKDRINPSSKISREQLEIVHLYLLIYEVKK